MRVERKVDRRDLDGRVADVLLGVLTTVLVVDVDGVLVADLLHEILHAFDVFELGLTAILDVVVLFKFRIFAANFGS